MKQYYSSCACAICFLSALILLILSLLFPPKEEPSEPDPAPTAEEYAAVPVYSAPVEVIEPEPEPYFPITDEERDIVERVVMAEAKGEDFDGMRLVAQCILTTAECYDMRPDDVVLVPGQYANPEDTASEEVKAAVSAVFDNGDFVTEEPIRFFYAPAYGESQWHESLAFVLEHGGHRFFKEP